ncbi:amidase family protein [Pseudonocardia sp. CA-107938]|uniref:amidase family protein n=1 Tax=Pseudonocardia sp. CA-107938 TaxID=3240021 RepID=UPI003D914487
MLPTAREVLADLAARRVSARELLDARLARHEAVHPVLNAVVQTDVERARQEAAAVDEARARGAELGPLAGLPITVKDCFDVAGMPAVSGNPAFVGRGECVDAATVAIARAAGAVVWGKTNTPLNLGDIQSYNEVFGTTTNPYDPDRTCGGSSGGSAAALAAGVTDLEIGTDIGGSLRHPANYCGVYALKPTWDRLPMRGVVPPLPENWMLSDLSVAGPMARTADDLAFLWEVLAGRTVPRGDVAGMRVALWVGEPGYPLAADVRGAVERAADVLRGQGAKVEVAAPPFGDGTGAGNDVYLALLFAVLGARNLTAEQWEQLAAHRGAEPGPRYRPGSYAYHATASYREYAAAAVARQRLRDRLAEWFTGFDAILCPVGPVPAFPHQHEGTVFDRDLDVDDVAVPYGHLFDWIALATACHAPAIAAPVGATAAGLPLGVQLVGRWDEEHRLLDLARALEAAIGRPAPPA